MTSKLATARAEANHPETVLRFDSDRLDRLLDDDGIDVVIASSKHNIQYLLGGYRFFFFGGHDALGISRYLPLLVYFKGQPERTTYIGNSMESWEEANGTIHAPEIDASTYGTEDAMQRAVRHISGGATPAEADRRRAGIPAGRRGGPCFETACRTSRSSMRCCRSSAFAPSRPRRSSSSSAKARSESSDSMLAVIASHGPGHTKKELAEALRREEVQRGLEFEYCLIACGASHNRAPSDQVWREGEVL